VADGKLKLFCLVSFIFIVVSLYVIGSILYSKHEKTSPLGTFSVVGKVDLGSTVLEENRHKTLGGGPSPKDVAVLPYGQDGILIFRKSHWRAIPLPRYTIFDTKSGKVTKQGEIQYKGFFSQLHAVPIENDRILLFGDSDAKFRGHEKYYVFAAFNPQDGSFKKLGEYALILGDFNVDTIKLNDGRVLITPCEEYKKTRGPTNTACVFNPKNNSLRVTGKLNNTRVERSALLKDGRVIFAGCHGARHCNSRSIEIYDPKTNKFTQGETLPPKVKDGVDFFFRLKDGNIGALGVSQMQTSAPSPLTKDGYRFFAFYGPPDFSKNHYNFVQLKDGRIMFIDALVNDANYIIDFEAMEAKKLRDNRKNAARANDRKAFLLNNGNVAILHHSPSLDYTGSEIELFVPN
jgi:hypothetical protein